MFSGDNRGQRDISWGIAIIVFILLLFISNHFKIPFCIFPIAAIAIYPFAKNIKPFIKHHKRIRKESETSPIFSQKSDPVIPSDDAYKKLMTSQLAAFWIETQDAGYKDEFLRRIQSCGLSYSNAERWLNFEVNILKRCPRPEMLSEDFIQQPMFSLAAPVLPQEITYYEKNFDYPLSYVIKLSDEAEWHYWNSHERDLPDNVWEEIFELADRNQKLFLPLGKYMTEKMGWTVEAVNKYSYNEQGMLDLMRWNRGSTRAASEPWGYDIRN